MAWGLQGRFPLQFATRPKVRRRVIPRTPPCPRAEPRRRPARTSASPANRGLTPGACRHGKAHTSSRRNAPSVSLAAADERRSCSRRSRSLRPCRPPGSRASSAAAYPHAGGLRREPPFKPCQQSMDHSHCVHIVSTTLAAPACSAWRDAEMEALVLAPPRPPLAPSCAPGLPSAAHGWPAVRAATARPLVPRARARRGLPAIAPIPYHGIAPAAARHPGDTCGRSSAFSATMRISASRTGVGLTPSLC